MKQVEMTVYIKKGKEYIPNRTCFDREAVYMALAADLLYKKVLHLPYINKIVHKNTLDGFRTVKVFYDNGVMCCYTIEERI